MTTNGSSTDRLNGLGSPFQSSPFEARQSPTQWSTTSGTPPTPSSSLTVKQRESTIFLTSISEQGQEGLHRFVPFDRVSDLSQLFRVCETRWGDRLQGKKIERMFFEIPCSYLSVWIEMQKGIGFDWCEFMRAVTWAWNPIASTPNAMLYVKLLLLVEEEKSEEEAADQDMGT